MISMSRYISIISGVGAGASVASRQLVLRLISTNSVLPPGVVMSFANAAAVGAFFGTSGEEYARAVSYFTFVSKSIGSPNALQYSRWVNSAFAATIYGDLTTKNISSWTSVTAGTLSFQHGATTVPITALNMSSQVSLTAVAAAIQAAIHTQASSDTQLGTCTVTYNTSLNQFILQGGTAGGTDTLTVNVGGANDISALLGFGTSGTVYAPSQAASTAIQAIQNSTAISNNYGSFAYVNAGSLLVNSDVSAISAWNASLNISYVYCVPVTVATASTISGLVIGNSGTALTLLANGLANDYAEQCPAEIAAATNYNTPNATQNYMFYQFPQRNIAVSDDNTANTMDTLRVNYIGVTQINGQQQAFYQRGVMCGGSTSPSDMNVYVNEMWLKSTIAQQIASLLLNSPEVPANNTGKAMITNVLISGAITPAQVNGVMSPGKTLTPVQQVYITQVSADPNAWRQVSTSGYWLNVYFTSSTGLGGNTEWAANYLLIYSKKDDVRAVYGTDIMM